jgi:crossover junction endodeoxyribonuclease RusA
MALILELPWASRDLHPNARVHWAKRAKAAKAARADAAWIAKAAGVSKMDAKALSITATFCPPDNRRRDIDSMLASMKSAFDGIADVVGVDDSTWSFTIRRSDPVKHGVVRVSIEETA